MQMGLKEKVSTSLDPWLCYYCGDCTETCPRDANPGELMMVMRRYLTSLYDWTGLSRKFYTSKVWEVGAIAFFALLVIAIFAFLAPAPDPTLTTQGGVKINSFAPIKWVHLGDWIMAGIIGGLLITNILRMYYKVIVLDKSVRVPLITHIKEFYNLIFHFASQWKLSKCDDKGYWGLHWLIMSGYTIMFILVVAMLPYFQTETIHPFYHPQRLLGYYATIGLLIGLTYILVGRIRRKEIKFKFSHISDWLFIFMLILTVVTGILVHFFRIEGWVMPTYYMYIAHLAVLVPMLMVEVPFSKWSHLAYRPFAIYFNNLKLAARKVEAVNNKTELATA
jgi:hypothetical protein